MFLKNLNVHIYLFSMIHLICWQDVCVCVCVYVCVCAEISVSTNFLIYLFELINEAKNNMAVDIARGRTGRRYLSEKAPDSYWSVSYDFCQHGCNG